MPVSAADRMLLVFRTATRWRTVVDKGECKVSNKPTAKADLKRPQLFKRRPI